MARTRHNGTNKLIAWLCVAIFQASLPMGLDRVLLCSGSDDHAALELMAGPTHDHHDGNHGEDSGGRPLGAELVSADDCSHVAINTPTLNARGSDQPRRTTHPVADPISLVSISLPDTGSRRELAPLFRNPPDRTAEQTLRSVRSTVLLI